MGGNISTVNTEESPALLMKLMKTLNFQADKKKRRNNTKCLHVLFICSKLIRALINYSLKNGEKKLMAYLDPLRADLSPPF